MTKTARTAAEAVAGIGAGQGLALVLEGTS